MKFLKEIVGYEPNETSELMAKIGNDHGYIVPGLGDAGDRIFGTK